MTYSDDMIVTAVLTHKTRREAAESLGMNERYLYTRLSKKPLQAKLEAAQANLANGVTEQLQSSIKEAVRVLSEIMLDDTAGAQTRVNAANSIISNYLKISERESIEKRLEALEDEL